METIGKQNEKEILSLIEELKQYDDEKGYRLSYKKVKKKLETTTKKIVEYGEASLEFLHPLLDHEETWSCLFALEILKEIKSEKSVTPLINFVKKNENGDYWEGCDDALWALAAIGQPAVKPLLEEFKSNFKDKVYYGYLVEALGKIKNKEVYSFMIGVLRDYINHVDNYDEWFDIQNFALSIGDQGNREAIPLLKELLQMSHLSAIEKREVESSIEFLENPKKYNKEIEEMVDKFRKDTTKEEINEKELLEEAIDFESKKDYDAALDCLERILSVYPKSYHALFLEARISRKLGQPNLLGLKMAFDEARKQKASKEVIKFMEEEKKRIEKDYRELQTTADEDFELNFKCLDCSKRQNLKPGLIWDIGEENKFAFENEIMCRYCLSHNLELTKDALMDLMGQKMRMFTGQASGILNVGKTVYVENKKMKFGKSYEYLLKRIEEEPHNGELYLRAGNSARKENKHEEAINHFKKAIELNPKLIAVYVNLIEIYSYRYNYYKIKEAKEEAIRYIKKMRELYETRDYNSVTLRNTSNTITFLRENESEFGLSPFFKQIKEEKIRDTIKKNSTFDIESLEKDMSKKCESSSKEAKKLIEENKGVVTLNSYLAFDKETGQSERIDTSMVLPIDQSKVCICGSGKFLKECCFNYVAKKKPFVANIDYETYSLLEPVKKVVWVEEKFSELVEGFKDDPRFYLHDESRSNAFFLYHSDTFYTDKNLGTVIFGTINIRKSFTGKVYAIIEALSKNRFDSLYDAVNEHIGLDD